MREVVMREVPTTKLGVLWRGDGKWYQTKRAAYYAIAKRLVIAKYSQQNWHAEDAADVPPLFSSDNGRYFDPKKWRRFCTRLAKFLMFVDSRRGSVDGELDAATEAMLHNEYEVAERLATKQAERAAAIRAKLDERARARGV